MKTRNKVGGKGVVGIGLIALDILLQNDSSVSNVAAGGTCGNVMAILSLLGWRSSPVGRLMPDPCTKTICADLEHWGVNTSFLNLPPHAAAPAIVERLRLDSAGIPFHSFTFACPWCGKRLPPYQPVTIPSIRTASEALLDNDVLFVDRASPGAVELALQFRARGKIVVFEPSSSRVDHLFQKLLSLSNIVKYSHERFPELDELMWPEERKLEVQTLGRGGLRFRSARKGRISAWQHLNAPVNNTVVDTCGAGDWATAGLIDMSCKEDLTALMGMSKEAVLKALGFAQRLGSWNCGYAGARGSMYAMSRTSLDRTITQLAGSGILTLPVVEGFLPESNKSLENCGLCSMRNYNAKLSSTGCS